MDPGEWGLRYAPVMIEVEEITGNKSSQKTLKVGQHFAHNLYTYKMEIIKIEVIENNKDIYNKADIFIAAYFSKESNGNYVKIGEYKIEPEHINEGKWFLINEK